jgi:hypothetical protein
MDIKVALFDVYAGTPEPGAVSYEFVPNKIAGGKESPSTPNAKWIGQVVSHSEDGSILSFNPAPRLPQEVIAGAERQMLRLKRAPGAPAVRIIPHTEKAVR